MHMESIGRNIRTARVQRKFRQEDLAEKTNLSPNYIGAIERGEKIPSLETLIVIMNALGVSSNTILRDVVESDYDVKSSILSEQIAALPRSDKETVYAVVETLVKQLAQGK